MVKVHRGKSVLGKSNSGGTWKKSERGGEDSRVVPSWKPEGEKKTKPQRTTRIRDQNDRATQAMARAGSGATTGGKARSTSPDCQLA